MVHGAVTAFAAALVAAFLSCSSAMFIVPLDKQYVPVMMNGRKVADKTAYHGQVFIGYPKPQNFTVVFDTGSGHFFIPGSSCKDPPCKLHNQYHRSRSTSAIDINHDGSRIKGKYHDRDQMSIAYGTGEVVGEFVQETLCLGAAWGDDEAERPENCARVRVVTARKMSTEPFSSFQFDGVLGLGLGALALDPEFHVFNMITKNRAVPPVFSVFLSHYDEVKSEIAFGGLDDKRMDGPVTWVPLTTPEQGYWRIAVQSVRVGNLTVDFCNDGTCTAILDTGTSLLGVPKDSVQDLLWHTAREVSGDEDIDCRTVEGPPLVFELGGNFTVQVNYEDYSRRGPSEVVNNITNETHNICRASLLPMDMPTLGQKVFIWGEPLLRKYYTAYDTENLRIGFAPVKQEIPASVLAAREAAAQAAAEAAADAALPECRKARREPPTRFACTPHRRVARGCDAAATREGTARDASTGRLGTNGTAWENPDVTLLGAMGFDSKAETPLPDMTTYGRTPALRWLREARPLPRLAVATDNAATRRPRQKVQLLLDFASTFTACVLLLAVAKWWLASGAR
mmetsp:Transcript_17217/g.37704  ORF Transcript_17217/g.37704 Transcript_17217/m.37704 type:complete len:567 (+) Transcript_17217:125-1825(+)